MKPKYNSALEMVIKIDELEKQLKKCQDIAMALGIEHNEKNAVIAKQAEIIAVLKACIYSIKKATGDDVVKELVTECGGDLMQIEDKYKGRE